MLIAFYGPDGSGKSTIINKLKEKINFEEYHFRPNVFKINLNKKSKVICGRPYAEKQHGNINSILKIIYTFVEYFVWGIINYGKIKSNKCFVVFDRYYKDLYIDQRRMRLNGYKRLIKFFEKMIPKPHLVICLVGDPKLISLRKNELTINEIAILNNRYQQVDEAYIFDSTLQSVDEIVVQIKHHIDNICHK